VDLSRKSGCVAISLKGMRKKAFWDAQNQNTQQINVLASGFVQNA